MVKIQRDLPPPPPPPKKKRQNNTDGCKWPFKFWFYISIRFVFSFGVWVVFLSSCCFNLAICLVHFLNLKSYFPVGIFFFFFFFFFFCSCFSSAICFVRLLHLKSGQVENAIRFKKCHKLSLSTMQ